MTEDDVERYLERIGFTDSRDITLDTLQQLQLSHLKAIPFENLLVHMLKPVLVHDLAILKQKVLVDKQGGYCFELNQLFLLLLLALGFQATAHAARTRWGVSSDGIGLPHLALVVHLDGKQWLVDVGCGSLACSQPMDIHDESTINTPYNTYRVVQLGPCAYAQQIVGSDGLWADSYTISTACPSTTADWVIGSWYASTHPDSHLCHDLVVSLHTAADCLLLHNAELTRRDWTGLLEHRVLTSREECLQVLEDVFQLPVGQLDSSLRIPDISE